MNNVIERYEEVSISRESAAKLESAVRTLEDLAAYDGLGTVDIGILVSDYRDGLHVISDVDFEGGTIGLPAKYITTLAIADIYIKRLISDYKDSVAIDVRSFMRQYVQSLNGENVLRRDGDGFTLTTEVPPKGATSSVGEVTGMEALFAMAIEASEYEEVTVSIS